MRETFHVRLAETSIDIRYSDEETKLRVESEKG